MNACGNKVFQQILNDFRAVRRRARRPESLGSPYKEKQMKYFKQKMKYGAAVAATTLMAAPVWAADTIETTDLVAGINSSKSIVIAIGTAIFGVIGILVALRYGKKAAN